MGDRLSLIKHIKGDCCRRLSLGFASSPQTDTFSCFNFVLKAELALFCHTEDRNYQRHFSQSSEAREHFSQERNQRSQRLSEGGISCFRKHLFHQEEILLAPNMWLLTQLHVDYLTLQQMSTCWEAFTFFRHSRIKSMMKRPLSTNVRTWESFTDYSETKYMDVFVSDTNWDRNYWLNYCWSRREEQRNCLTHTPTDTLSHTDEYLRSNFIQCDFPGEHPQEPEPQPQHWHAICVCVYVYVCMLLWVCMPVCVCIELHLSAWNRSSDKTFLLFSLTYSTER